MTSALENTPWEVVDGSRFHGRVTMSRVVVEAENWVSILLVRFSAGARTNRHSHGKGQLLWVTSGTAIISTQSGSQLVEAGSSHFTPPGVPHWHGAFGNKPMEHLSITISPETTWMEPITEVEYKAVTEGLVGASAP